MPPLLYIFLLAAVLLLMVYWVLSAPTPGNTRAKIPVNKFYWESAQELFKYLETEEFYLPTDSIKILKTDSGHVRAYWRISPDKWQDILKQLRLGHKELVLRINQKDNNESEVKVKLPVGCYDWDFPAENNLSVSLGIKDKNNYTPLLQSNKLGEMQ